MIRRAALLAFTLLVGARPGAAQQCQPSENTRQVERRLQGLLDSLLAANPSVPGISLAALSPSRCLAWAGAAGVADKSTGERLTARHTHRIASNTKTYVAAAILRLIEDGKLGLDDPLPSRISAPHVASLRRDGYAVDRITIRHLLNHSAGIYDYAMDDRFVAAGTAKPTYRWTRSEQLDSAMVWGAPYNAPGEAFHYTDTGYILLGEVIERITGKGLGESLRTLLHYDAVGLTDTWLETLEPVPPRAGPRAAQYLGDVDIRQMDPSIDLYGGGGLAATPMDMARFNRALFAGGVFAKPATTTLMITTRGPQGPRSYSAGIVEMKAAGETGWGHSGFWNTWSYHLPDRDLTLAASVTQQGNSAVARALYERAIATVLR